MTMSECEDGQIVQMVVGNVCFVVYYADLKSSSTMAKLKRSKCENLKTAHTGQKKWILHLKLIFFSKNPPHPCTNLPASEKNTAW